jgi:L-ascorbate metabolism protein UlaG (beta-lactamase superfamily)
LANVTQAWLRLTYVGHATVSIELGGTRLLTDPLLVSHVGPLRIQRRPGAPGSLAPPHAALVSHGHLDHLHLPSLRLLERSTPLIVPRGLARALVRESFRNVEELGIGDSTRVGTLRVTATPAAHRGFRSRLGRGSSAIGYLIDGFHSVYFAGDTDLFAGMATLADGLDLALLPVGGWGPKLGAGHLDPARAAEALTLLRPRVAVPIHWGTLVLPGLASRRLRYLTEPAETFARLAARVAPEVEVRIVPPGGSTVFAE